INTLSLHDALPIFAQLSHSFLDMAEQLARRSDYIATFSAHLTHELKSPLTSIKGAAELLLDSLQSKSDTLTRMEQKNFISNILGDTGRLEAMTQRLRELARAETVPQNERTELSQVIGGLKSRFPTRAIEATGCLKPSNALDHNGRCHAAGRAHRHQRTLEIAPLQLVKHGADQDRAGCTDGMAERDRAAIDVDLVAVELEVADELFGDDRKCLI